MRATTARLINRLLPNKLNVVDSVKDWVNVGGEGRILPVRSEMHRHYDLPRRDEDPVDCASLGGQHVLFPDRYLAVVPDVCLRGYDGCITLPEGSCSVESAPET